MSIQLQDSKPTAVESPSPPPLDEGQRFPAKLFLFTVLVMTGLYFYLIFVVPRDGAEEASWPTRAVLWTGQFAEAHPILLGFALVALLAPALAFRAKAAWYVPRLLGVMVAVCLATLVFSLNPWSAVSSFLETERPLPETIRGR